MGSIRPSWPAPSRSSIAPSTSGGRRLRECDCDRRRSAATGGRRSRVAGGAELGQLPKPAKPLIPRDGGVRRRRGREDEEPRPAERVWLQAEPGPRAEGAAVRLLADEGEPSGLQVACDPCEPLGG